jgi:hypothetical protein
MRLKRARGLWDGGPDALRQTDADMTSNESLGFKILDASESRLCGRCGRRAASPRQLGKTKRSETE